MYIVVIQEFGLYGVVVILSVVYFRVREKVVLEEYIFVIKYLVQK